ncbi:CRE-SMU-2 protein [Caenorhabditis remanei]|uniref:CRE-SMU-2 protein n=1 Tax=Caenorhabditis remanei TaxID=31234 RepID=E3M1M1_CAERE|nr:CRE-SMU-2 protein [Caenorhabditis remanei]
MADNPSNLRNEDFRKLLTSARSDRPASSAFAKPADPKSNDEKPASFKHKHLKPAKFKKPQAPGQAKGKKEKTEADEDEAHLKNILKNYRDRAAERRKAGDEKEDTTKLTAAYRAVPGDARSALDQADLRKQAILESKYLGGDLEHTHLVKGLDYSLLNKVRSELTADDDEEDDDIEAFDDKKSAKPSEVTSLTQELAQSHSENRMVRSLHRVLFKNEVPLRNDLFAKGRMAYVVELEDEETDIPTTLLRSLHDLPRAESAQSIQANNLIISKLSHVLAHLRSEPKKKKKEEFRTSAASSAPSAPKGDDIYDDLDDYVPSRKPRDSRDNRDNRDRDRRRDRSRSRERDRDRYFEKSANARREEEQKRREQQRERERAERERLREKEKEKEKAKEKERERKRKEMEASSGYDECYPGGLVEMGGSWDSDEEADYSKMDAGPKKNQAVNRWDFDTEEEYATYMEGREALPKAAYQYGVKNGEGRKNKKQSAVSEAKRLDRELNEINKIMDKRKIGGEGGGGDYKKPKY